MTTSRLPARVDVSEQPSCAKPTSAAIRFTEPCCTTPMPSCWATTTALANGRSKIEERLARWLLMAQNRVDSDQLPLTHEFLSLMLGVRRAGVTAALQALERKELISRNRGKILILDRKGLEKQSNGTYVPTEK